jgi:hypothetical protein
MQPTSHFPLASLRLVLRRHGEARRMAGEAATMTEMGSKGV